MSLKLLVFVTGYSFTAGLIHAEKVCYAFEGSITFVIGGYGEPELPFEGNEELSDGLRKLKFGDRVSGTLVYDDETLGVPDPRFAGQVDHTMPVARGAQVTLNVSNKARGRLQTGGSLNIGINYYDTFSRFSGNGFPFDFEPPDSPDRFYFWAVSVSFGLGELRPGAQVKRPTLSADSSGFTFFAADENGQPLENWFPWVSGPIDKLRPCLDFIDPVSLYGSPKLLDDSMRISADVDLLARSGRSVEGIAADGVSQIVVRAAVDSADESYQITVLNEILPEGDTADFGGVAKLSGPRDPTTNLPLVASILKDVRSVITTSGPRLLFVYRAPADFPTTYSQYGFEAKRNVLIRVEKVVAGIPQLIDERSLSIVRPPTMFIHGAWSTPTYAFGESGLLGRPQLTTFPLRYDTAVNLGALVPSYDEGYCPSPPLLSADCIKIRADISKIIRGQIRSNAFGFKRNAGIVFDQIETYMDAFRAGSNAVHIPVAAVQADIVAHSLGGLVTRSLPTLAQYTNDFSFGRGRVHKLITISTPHLGSPIAIALHDPANTCVRYLQALGGAVTIERAQIDGAWEVGASWVLRGDTTNGLRSPELADLRRVPPLPTAHIYGEMTASQLASIDGTDAQKALMLFCGQTTSVSAASPFAVDFTSERYTRVFSRQASDATVSVLSSTNGVVSDGFPIFAVHSKGMVEESGFGGPYVTQEASGITSQVLTLLNTRISIKSVFRPSPSQ